MPYLPPIKQADVNLCRTTVWQSVYVLTRTTWQREMLRGPYADNGAWRIGSGGNLVAAKVQKMWSNCPRNKEFACNMRMKADPDYHLVQSYTLSRGKIDQTNCSGCVCVWWCGAAPPAARTQDPGALGEGPLPLQPPPPLPSPQGPREREGKGGGEGGGKGKGYRRKLG